MAGDISQLTTLGGTLNRIGDEHVGLDGKKEIVKGSSNWLGRTVNWIKSKLGLGDGGTKAAMQSVVKTIRSTEGMGDRFAQIAEGRLGSALTRGTPITGREVSKVISDLVRSKENEDTLRSETIKANTKELCEKLCDVGEDSPLMRALDQQMKRFNVPSSRFGELSYADIMEMSDFVHKGLESRALRAGHSPTPDEAQPLIERACTKLVSQMVKSDIDGFATTLGGHDGKDSPLMKAVEQRARERGIEIDVEPGDLEKLARKFEGELTKSCLLDKDNLHPPTLKEAQAAQAKAVNGFLDALAVVDGEKGLDATQKAAVKKTMVSSGDLYSTGMARSLCRTVIASKTFAEVLLNKQTSQQDLLKALDTYEKAMGDTLEANLKKGVEGGVESGAVRDESFALGLSFTGLDKAGCRKAFYELNALDSSFTKLRFDVQGEEGEASARRNQVLVRCLDTVGKRGGLPGQILDNARRVMGPGCVHVDHLRAKLGQGVHGHGGVKVPGGFDMDKALLTFTTNVNEDMDRSLDAMGLEPKGMPPSLVQKASHFSSGFLGDLFRNGVVVDGERIVASGTQDPKEMERALDEFIAKFPGIEEAGRVTRPLFQNVGASMMLVLMDDKASSGQIGLTNTAAGEKIKDSLVFSITSKGNGNYDVRADFGLQRAHGGEPGMNNEPLGLATRLDLSIIGANTDNPKPLIRATGFDFVFGKIE